MKIICSFLVVFSSLRCFAAEIQANDRLNVNDLVSALKEANEASSTKVCLDRLREVLVDSNMTILQTGQIAVTAANKPMQIISPGGRTTEVKASGNCQVNSSNDDQSYKTIMSRAFARFNNPKFARQELAGHSTKCRVGGDPKECDVTPGGSGSPMINRQDVIDDPRVLYACSLSGIPELRELSARASPQPPPSPSKPPATGQ